MSRDSLNTVVEVIAPLRVSHAWIAFACQKAGLARPRWDHERRVWNTTAEGAPIAITCPTNDRTLRVASDATHEENVRRFVSALVTGMMQRARKPG